MSFCNPNLKPLTLTLTLAFNPHPNSSIVKGRFWNTSNAVTKEDFKVREREIERKREREKERKR